MKRFFTLILSALTVLSSLPLASSIVGASERTYDGVNITHHEGSYDHLNRTMTVYRYDFSANQLNYYASDEALAISDRTKILVADGVLKCKENSEVSFGSAVCLGDNYGLEDGYLKFDLCLKGGSVTLGLRCSRTAVSPDEGRGVWITFDSSGKLTVKDFYTGLTAQAPISESFEQTKSVRVDEKRDEIILSCGEKTILNIKPNGTSLGFYDGDGKKLAETNDSKLECTGYWELYMKNFDGYIDNVEFSCMEIDDSLPETDTERKVDYSTWSAVDDLGRVVMSGAANDGEDSNRYVGLFYFLCWRGDGIHAVNNTELYKTLGDSEFKKYFEEGRGGENYWAEPYFGYYLNTDTWVYRKHAYMLEAAGVDFIFLDVSNRETFVKGHTALFDTWLQIRKEGGDTPQIVFFNGDDAMDKTFESNMEVLFDTVYSKENWDKYSELFFVWDGKPLVFGNKSKLSQSMLEKVEESFTIRGSWAWTDSDGYWPWMQDYVNKNGVYSFQDGGWGRDENGKIESLAVCMGHHPASNKGRSYVNGIQPESSIKGDFGFSMTELAAQGKGFEASFTAMQKLIERKVSKDQPFVMMLTGWNEWIAGCYYSNSKSTFINYKTNWKYIDQFNCEYSRDGEPMRNIDGEGIGDNFYYQMSDYIRQFKGTGDVPKADNQSTVDIYDKTSWNKIQLTYTDNIGDAELRNTASYDIDYRYVNNTGRNDFSYAKVSQDSEYLYFMTVCNNPIVVDDGTNWMNLFIDSDGNRQNGWGGYDYIINRERDSYVVSVEKINDDGTTQRVGFAYYCIDGEYMAIRVSKKTVGIEGNTEQLYFKWADNSVNVGGDIMAFMDTGDTAPNDRYSFDYRCDNVAEYDITYSLPIFTKTTVAATGNGGKTENRYPNISGNGNTVLNDVNVSFSFDNDGYTAGSFLPDTPIASTFEYVAGTSASTAIIKKGKNGNYVRQSGVSDFRTFTDINGAYVFSLDVRAVEYGNNAVYIRGEMPGTLTKYNKRHSEMAGQEVIQVFNYYEWDWYTENGGSDGNSSISGSGLGVFPLSDGLELHIKKYVEDGLTVSSAVATLPFPDDFKTNSDGFYNIRFEDNEKEIKILVNNTLIARLTLENPGVTYESDGTGQKYYGKATLYDKDGTELVTVENTRLNSSGSQIAITTRDQAIEYDNLTFAYSEEVSVEGNRAEKAVVAADGTAAYTPDTRLLDEMNGTDSSTVTDGETSDGENQGGKTSQIIIWVVVGAAVLAVAVAAVVLVIKKKKQKE